MITRDRYLGNLWHLEKAKTNMAAVLKVRIQADAFMVCLTHALSTDREEVMGLLIGEVGLHII